MISYRKILPVTAVALALGLCAASGSARADNHGEQGDTVRAVQSENPAAKGTEAETTGAKDVEKIMPNPEEVKADIINNDGAVIGSVDVKQGAQGVVIDIDAHDLPPGKHGMHFHKVGDCSDHTAFKTAGGHIMPSGKPHGFLNPKGPHEGNLPNLIVRDDGTVQVELYSDMVTMDHGPAALLDDDGSALIIHTNEDDHMSQPIGGSGARIACVAFKK